MTKYEAIFNYQKTDIELRKIYDEIEKSKVAARLDHARAEFNNAKARAAESEKTAESLVSSINAMEKTYGESVKTFAELSAKLDEDLSDEERSTCIARLDGIRKKLNEIEKRLSEVKPRAEKTIKEYRAGQETGKRMREEFSKAKEDLDRLKKSKEEEIAALKKKLGDLQKGIEPSIMEQYTALKAEGKYVAFVETPPPPKNGAVFCRGCGIELPQKLKSELAENGVCRCEKCRRVLFVRQ